MKPYLATGLANILLGVGLAAVGADLQWSAVLLLWFNMLFYALARFKQRVFFAAFLVAFFVFLMGRETLIHVIAYQPQTFDPTMDAHVHRVLGVGLAVSWLTYHTWSRRERRRLVGRESKPPRPYEGPTQSTQDSRVDGVRRASRMAFYLTIVPAYYSAFSRAGEVADAGYTSVYTQSGSTTDESLAAVLTAQLTLVNLVALAIYLATMPALRSARWPILLWGGYLALTLASGQRGSFITGFLLLACYGVVRTRVSPGEKWVTRRALGLLVLASPALILLLAAVESARGVGSDYQGDSAVVVMEFFYNQGVSSTVIANGYFFRDVIPDQNYLLEFLHSGLPARLLGIPVLHGNTLDHAADGGSYTHSLAYAVLGEMYLAGRGTGSSYLAEAYQTFEWVGVAFIAALYGLVLAFMDAIPSYGLLGTSLTLIVAQDVFWAPRGSASGLLSTLFAPSAVFTIVLVSVGGWIIARMGARRRGRPAAGRLDQGWERGP